MIIRIATKEDRKRLASFELRFAKARGGEPILWVSSIQSWFDGYIDDAPMLTEADKKAYLSGVKKALRCNYATGISERYII